MNQLLCKKRELLAQSSAAQQSPFLKYYKREGLFGNHLKLNWVYRQLEFRVKGHRVVFISENCIDSGDK